MCDHPEPSETDPAGRSFCGCCGEILDLSTTLTLAETDSSQFHSLKKGCIAEKDNFREYKEYVSEKRFHEVSSAAFRSAGLYLDESSRSQILRLIRECEERNLKGNQDNLVLAASFIVARDKGSSVDLNTFAKNARVHVHILKRWVMRIARDSPLSVTPPDVEQVVQGHLSALALFDCDQKTTITQTMELIALMIQKGDLQSRNLVPGSLAALVAVVRSNGVKVKLNLAVSACELTAQRSLCYGKFKLAKQYLK